MVFLVIPPAFRWMHLGYTFALFWRLLNLNFYKLVVRSFLTQNQVSKHWMRIHCEPFFWFTVYICNSIITVWEWHIVSFPARVWSCMIQGFSLGLEVSASRRTFERSRSRSHHVLKARSQWRSDGGPTGRSPRAALVKGRHTESCQKLCCVREIK